MSLKLPIADINHLSTKSWQLQFALGLFVWAAAH
jgi:hypothetical protein